MELASGVLNGWRVLVLEDDKDNSMLLCMVFSHFGAEVIQVRNGVDGLKQISEKVFTVVLCDLSMPELDGCAFMKQARQAGMAKRMPIIAVTAHAMAHEKDKVVETGFFDRVNKPINDTEGLVRHVIDVLKRFQLESR